MTVLEFLLLCGLLANTWLGGALWALHRLKTRNSEGQDSGPQIKTRHIES